MKKNAIKKNPVPLESRLDRDVGRIIQRAAEGNLFNAEVEENLVKNFHFGPVETDAGRDLQYIPESDSKGSLFTGMNNYGGRVRSYFSNLKDKIKSKFKKEEALEETAVENPQAQPFAKEHWYNKPKARMAGFAFATIASLGAVAVGLYKHITHSAAEESLQYLKSSYSIHSNRAVAADEKVIEIREEIDALNKRLKETTLDTTVTYEKGANRWNKAKTALIIDNDGAIPSDAQVADATNALCRANGINEPTPEYDFDIDFKVPMAEWTAPIPPETGNPNYAVEGIEEDASSIMPNIVKAYNDRKAAIENERTAAEKSLNKAEAERQKEKEAKAGLSGMIRGEHEKAADNAGGEAYIAAGVLGLGLVLDRLLNKRNKKKYSLETILDKLEYKPNKIVDSRKTERYMGVLGEAYNMAEGLRFDNDKYSAETRQAVAANLYACRDVADKTRDNKKYMSVKDIALFTGLSEYAVEKAGMEIRSRSDILKELRQSRMEQAIDYSIAGLSNTEIAEQMHVGKRTVAKWIADYKPKAKV